MTASTLERTDVAPPDTSAIRITCRRHKVAVTELRERYIEIVPTDAPSQGSLSERIREYNERVQQIAERSWRVMRTRGSTDTEQ